MPYYITDEADDCSGFATVKEDGEVIGCHTTKQDAVDQMIAVSLAEGIEPGGERQKKKKKMQYRALPDNYRSALEDDVPEGRACGNCLFFNESKQITEDGLRKAYCERWEDYAQGGFYCNAWQEKSAQRAEARVKELDSEERNEMSTSTVDLTTSNVETRDLPMTMANFEFRDDSDFMSFRGYAAVFNSESEPLPFRETILPGAFSRSLRSRNNVKMFVNHNMDQVLASSRAGTLKLSEDNRGLLVEADLPPTSYAKDLSIMMRRGDVDSMSFGFSVPRNGDSWNEERTERTLKEVRLHEVSIVTSFPAYASTTAQVRTIDILAKRAGCEVDSIADAIRSIESGAELSSQQREVIAGLVDALTLQSAPVAEPSNKLNLLRSKLDHAYKAI